MMAKAIEQRWGMTPERREIVLETLFEVLQDKQASRRERLAAASGLLSAEKQNQADDHKLVDIQLSLRNSELDAIASDLGLDVGLIEDAARAASRLPIGTQEEDNP